MEHKKLPLLEKTMRDARSFIPGATAGIMQLMYPSLGAAVASQSEFFNDPFSRIYRSIPQIWATVLAPDAIDQAKRLRNVHKNINGVDDLGRPFFALEPETFWWAHATFTWEIFEAHKLFFHGSVPKEKLYQETVEWYRRYHLSMKPVPPNYKSFLDKFYFVCRNQLEMTPAANKAYSLLQKGTWRLPLLDYDLQDPATRYLSKTLIIGMLPATLKRKFDLPWSYKDQVAFGASCSLVRNTFRFVPRSVHHKTTETSLRVLGALTRSRRFVV